MKKYLLLSLACLGFSLCETAESQAAPLASASISKAYPHRLERTMRRLHRQAQTRARKNRYKL